MEIYWSEMCYAIRSYFSARNNAFVTGNHVRITRLTDEIEKFSLSRKIDRTKFEPKHLCQLPKRVFHYRVKKKVFSVQNVIGVFC